MDKMILIDLETQSFEVTSGIYEVACLVVENYTIVEQFYLGKEIKGYKGERRYGYGFHDISRDQEQVRKFRQFIEKYNYPLVAHNCPFDRKFLVNYNWIQSEYPTYCSMRAIRNTEKSLDSYSMKYLIKHYKVAEEVEHTAMSDVNSLYQILNIVKPQTWIPVGVSINNQLKKPNIDLKVDSTQVLANETVCFTGTSLYTRSVMQGLAIKNGAEISDNISSRTTMLVVGMNAGSKLDKAQEKGISIISDEDFMQMINLKEVLKDVPVNMDVLNSNSKAEEMKGFIDEYIEKKWYDYEPDLWTPVEGEVDSEGVEWKPLWVIGVFREAQGYYVSKDYRLRKPNGNIVSMQKTILGKSFKPVYYAYLFLTEEYNKHITDYIQLRVDLNYDSRLEGSFFTVQKYEYCTFVMWEKRPKSIEEAVEREVNKRYEKENGICNYIFFDDESKSAHDQEVNEVKKRIRDKVILEWKKHNKKKSVYDSIGRVG